MFQKANVAIPKESNLEISALRLWEAFNRSEAFNSPQWWEEEIVCLLRADPGLVSAVDIDGNNLFHYIAYDTEMTKQSILEVIKSLDVANVYDYNHDQKSSIDLAIQEENVTFIAAIVEAIPGVVNNIDNHTGRTLLHQMCNSKYVTLFDSDWYRVRLERRILDLNPLAASIVDINGNLPLHLLVNRIQLGLDTFLYLLRPNIKALTHAEYDDEDKIMSETVINKAIEFNHGDVVQYICENFPQCLAVPGKTGNLPLHIAALNCHKLTADIVKLIFEANKEAVNVSNLEDCTPIDILFYWHNCTLEIIDLFRLFLSHTRSNVVSCFTVLRAQGSTEDTPFHKFILRLILTVNNEVYPNGSVELAKIVYGERRMAMFLGLTAIAEEGHSSPFLYRLRVNNKDIFRHVVTYL